MITNITKRCAQYHHIEREFVKDSGIIYDATVTDIDLETKRYKLKWDDEDEFLEKEDNYTGGQIGIYIHPKEMSKFKVGETVRKSLKDYGMMERYHILIKKTNCTM